VTLHDVINRLRDDHHVIASMGLELEWYVVDKTQHPLNDTSRHVYISALHKAFERDFYDAIAHEDGSGQVEIALPFRSDIHALIADGERIKSVAQHVARQMDCDTLFTAKPFAQDYGSGLHLHLHLEDLQGVRLFNKTDEGVNAVMQHVIGGLLDTMLDYMPTFCPDETSLIRYTSGYNAPTTVSWGMNNRSCALRIPDGTAEKLGMDAILGTKGNRQWRIEHRVACAHASVHDVVIAILQGVLYGLEQSCAAPKPIYGIADDAQYAHLQKLIINK
jgi:glutamine synthetase